MAQKINLNTADVIVEDLTNVRSNLSEIVNKVKFGNQNFVISKHGKPAAAIVPISVIEKIEKEKQELFDLIRDSQDENLDPDEVLDFVVKMQHEARKEGEC